LDANDKREFKGDVVEFLSNFTDKNPPTEGDILSFVERMTESRAFEIG
jgi:hypothetical protein